MVNTQNGEFRSQLIPALDAIPILVTIYSYSYYIPEYLHKYTA